MTNFTFKNPTKIYFGEQEEKLKDELLPYGKNVLLVYGGGSIKRNGLYEKITSILEGCNLFELSGVEPNPRVESVRRGASICKENNIDVIVAIGGGSSMDCAKAIAAAAKSDIDAWELVMNPQLIKDATPLFCVVTLAATGSEMNNGGVISNLSTNQKIGFGSPYCFPKASFLNPVNTFSVPKNQTAAGCADIISHVMECYFSYKDFDMSLVLCEGIINTIIKYAKIAIDDPTNYEARANIMWAGTLAINGLVGLGIGGGPWPCHTIEHELSAYYDITHGVGLAIVTPRWMEHVLNDKNVSRFARFGRNIFNLTGEDMLVAKESIKELYNFFKSLGIPMTLSELNIDNSKFKEMATHGHDLKNTSNCQYPLEITDYIEILNKCL